MTEIQCQNCGAIYETEYPLHGSLTTLVECAICDRDDDEEEKPEVEPLKVPVKPRGPYKKSPDSQLYDSGVKKKCNKQIIEFLRDNCLTKDNEMLVKSIKSKFGVSTTINTIKYWMVQNKIGRRRMKKEADGAGVKYDDKKELPTLSPEDNY